MDAEGVMWDMDRRLAAVMKINAGGEDFSTNYSMLVTDIEALPGGFDEFALRACEFLDGWSRGVHLVVRAKAITYGLQIDENGVVLACVARET